MLRGVDRLFVRPKLRERLLRDVGTGSPVSAAPGNCLGLGIRFGDGDEAPDRNIPARTGVPRLLQPVEVAASCARFPDGRSGGSIKIVSPRPAAHSIAPGEVAATQTGGCGRCFGFGSTSTSW